MTVLELFEDPAFAQVIDELTPDELAELWELHQQEWALHHPDLWARDYFPEAYYLSFGPHHQELFAFGGERPTGAKGFIGAPRGSGKSTSALVAKPLNVIARGSHPVVVIVRINQRQADAGLGLIRQQLQSPAGKRLIEDYPQLEIVSDSADRLILRGGRILALGAGAPVRGIVEPDPETGKIHRPSLVIGDDLETSEQARSKVQTDRLEEWLFGDVANLGTPTQPVDILLIGTTLEPDAVAVRALEKRGRFASWHSERFSAIVKDPETGEERSMWPEGLPLDYLKALITPGTSLFIGTYTFAKEYLLDPLDRTDALVKRAYLQWHRYSPEELRQLRFKAVGIDPAATEKDSKAGDESALVGVGLDALNRVIVFRADAGYWSKGTLFDNAGKWTDAYDATVAYEGVAGFKWGVQELKARAIPHRAVQPVEDKVSRFIPMALLYESRWVIHDESLRGGALEHEVLGFPTYTSDNLVDALAHAAKLATNAFRRSKPPEPEEPKMVRDHWPVKDQRRW